MQELDILSPLLKTLGFSLDASQPYTSGERYLMAGGKLVLAGTTVDGAKVIIKASRQADGKKEIESEKRSRDLMRSLSFADKKILLPEELYFGTAGGYVILVIRFIPQEKVFAAHTIQEQFFIALSAFEAQESFHATTFEHMRAVKEVFPVLGSKEYLTEFKRLEKAILAVQSDNGLSDLLGKTEAFLKENVLTIDRYANYLTHTDFVPHNFRLVEHTLFMLDCVPNYATVHFGNKYEGWARFLNYMLIHSPELEKLLSDYILDTRGADEYLALRLMRAYKMTFLLDYYARSLAKTTGDLHTLTKARLTYWKAALRALLEDATLPREVTEEYIKTRNSLRSREETERQKDFAIV